VESPKRPAGRPQPQPRTCTCQTARPPPPPRAAHTFRPGPAARLQPDPARAARPPPSSSSPPNSEAPTQPAWYPPPSSRPRAHGRTQSLVPRGVNVQGFQRRTFGSGSHGRLARPGRVAHVRSLYGSGTVLCFCSAADLVPLLCSAAADLVVVPPALAFEMRCAVAR
jgi:hypothetical protein